MKTQIFMNHIGFLPQGEKHFVIKHPRSMEFTVINRWGNRIVFNGRLKAYYGGDLDEAFVGDFSNVTEEGTYLIKCADTVSRIIVIHKKPYEMAMRTIYNYYPTQRCGDSSTGWNSPCHLKPAQDINTGEMKDMSGGWHQSCDTRKWMYGTTVGLMALPELGRYKPLKKWENGKVAEEIKWGNRYFHKMVRKDGGLMDFISIPNDWDDHITRQLNSDDASFMTTFTMISGQCNAAIYFKEEDPQYAAQCLDYALKLWAYANSSKMKDEYNVRAFKYHEYLPYLYRKSRRDTSCYYGDKLFAAMMLYKATGSKSFLEEASATADSYCSLQVGGNVEENIAAACFWLDDKKAELSTAFAVGSWGPIGLCMLVEELQSGDNRNVWLNTIRNIARQLTLCSEKNPWGLIPCYWFMDDKDGGRKGGSLYYKYFLYEIKTVVGINYDLLHRALFLLKSAKYTGFEDKCREVAFRQVDWVLGCNPLDASFCEGVGYNQQQTLINGDEFIPPVPQITGAVQLGMGCVPGTDTPNIDLDTVTCEYDMPCTSLLMWTIKEMLECE